MRRRACIALAAALAGTLGAAPACAELHVSPAGVRMIERFEGFVSTPAGDPVGIETIGFGTTTADVDPLPAHVTPAQAERLLIDALDRHYLPPIRRLFGGPLRRLYTIARADALASVTYNLGTGLVLCAPGFTSMCAALGSRDPRRIGAAIRLYDHAAGRTLPGLSRRRRAEASPWSRPIRRFEDFRPVEVHLIRSWERLAGQFCRAARRRLHLRMALRAAAGRIARAARQSRGDWLSHRRLIRYAALLRRA